MSTYTELTTISGIYLEGRDQLHLAGGLPAQKQRPPALAKKLRRWAAGLRQIVETLNEKLHNAFRLDRERPHALAGFQTRLAAKAALHNFCIWLNLESGRQPLEFATLLHW